MNDAFGYRAVVKNDEWQIPADDPKLKKGPPDVVTMHPRIELDRKQLGAAAEKMASMIPAEHEEAHLSVLKDLPKEVRFASDLGLHSKVHQAVTMAVIR